MWEPKQILHRTHPDLKITDIKVNPSWIPKYRPYVIPSRHTQPPESGLFGELTEEPSVSNGSCFPGEFPAVETHQVLWLLLRVPAVETLCVLICRLTAGTSAHGDLILTFTDRCYYWLGCQFVFLCLAENISQRTAELQEPCLQCKQIGILLINNQSAIAGPTGHRCW